MPYLEIGLNARTLLGYCRIVLNMASRPTSLARSTAFHPSPAADDVDGRQKRRRTSLAQTFWGVVSDNETRKQALQAAMYTGLVNVLICVLAALLIAVYLVLQSFLKPLLWASLCGVVLFPFKCKSTAIFAGWLSHLERDNTPLLVGVLLLPFRLFSLLSNRCEQIMFRWKRLTVAVVVYAASVWMFYHSPFGMWFQDMNSLDSVYVCLSSGWSTCVQWSQSIELLVQHWLSVSRWTHSKQHSDIDTMI